MQKLFDRITSTKGLDRIEYIAVVVALILFFVHLLLIVLARYTPWLQGIEIDPSFLSALQTPLTVILYYEVLLLILAFPKPLVYSMGKQYEIATLLAVREVLKMISGADITVTTAALSAATVINVFITLFASVMMFGLLGVFYYVGKQYQPDQKELLSFVGLKRLLAILFSFLLIGYVVYDAIGFLISPAVNATGLVQFPVFQHYRDVFLWMIFADIIVFLLSLLHVSAYRSLFLYSLFIVTTVLIRLSLLAEPPYSHLINLGAIAAGTAVLWIFNRYKLAQVGA